MNIEQLQTLLASVARDAQGQPLRCVCMDEGMLSDVNVSIAKLDAEGALVPAWRRDALSREPSDVQDAQETYNNDLDYWKEHYPTFDAFYAWMESERLREIKLVDEAVDVVLLSAQPHVD